MIPVWFCVVKIEMISALYGFQGYRIVKVIPITADKYSETWDAEVRPLIETDNYQAMLFVREPDTNPVKDAYMKELQNGE